MMSHDKTPLTWSALSTSDVPTLTQAVVYCLEPSLRFL